MYVFLTIYFIRLLHALLCDLSSAAKSGVLKSVCNVSVMTRADDEDFQNSFHEQRSHLKSTHPYD